MERPGRARAKRRACPEHSVVRQVFRQLRPHDAAGSGIGAAHTARAAFSAGSPHGFLLTRWGANPEGSHWVCRRVDAGCIPQRISPGTGDKPSARLRSATCCHASTQYTGYTAVHPCSMTLVPHQPSGRCAPCSMPRQLHLRLQDRPQLLRVERLPAHPGKDLCDKDLHFAASIVPHRM